MEKKPLFFKDAGEMGDVLSEAKGLAKKIQLLNKHLDTQIKEIDELKSQIEEESHNEVIRESLGERIGNVKNKFTSMISNLKGKKDLVEQKKEELQADQAEIQTQKQEILNKQNEVDPEQKANLTKELRNISQLEETVSEKLAKLEKTQASIENILNENKEKIRENILTNEEVEFIKLKYFSLIRSRLSTKIITSPVSNNSYVDKDWKLTLMENEIVAKTMKGIFKNKNDVYFDIIFSTPMDIEGYVYKKKGMEVTEQIKKFVNSSDNESYSTLVLVCPTGWNDEIKSRVETICHSNVSIYLADLSENKMFFNRNDEKTMTFSEWFAPLSMDDEINDLVEKLKVDINNGDIQFRADKVVEKYKIPRKIVISAFHKIVESKNAELIDRSEGAKDIILLTR